MTLVPVVSKIKKLKVKSESVSKIKETYLPILGLDGRGVRVDLRTLVWVDLQVASLRFSTHLTPSSFFSHFFFSLFFMF